MVIQPILRFHSQSELSRFNRSTRDLLGLFTGVATATLLSDVALVQPFGFSKVSVKSSNECEAFFAENPFRLASMKSTPL